MQQIGFAQQLRSHAPDSQVFHAQGCLQLCRESMGGLITMMTELWRCKTTKRPRISCCLNRLQFSTQNCNSKLTDAVTRSVCAGNMHDERHFNTSCWLFEILGTQVCSESSKSTTAFMHYNHIISILWTAFVDFLHSTSGSTHTWIYISTDSIWAYEHPLPVFWKTLFVRALL